MLAFFPHSLPRRKSKNRPKKPNPFGQHKNSLKGAQHLSQNRPELSPRSNLANPDTFMSLQSQHVSNQGIAGHDFSPCSEQNRNLDESGLKNTQQLGQISMASSSTSRIEHALVCGTRPDLKQKRPFNDRIWIKIWPARAGCQLLGEIGCENTHSVCLSDSTPGVCL